MSVSETSIEAYEKVLPKIGDMQGKVLDVMKDLTPRTDAMIAKKMSLPINRITGRRNELVKKGCLQEAYKDYCKVTGGRSTYWVITECGKEVNNFRSKEEFVYGIE